MDNIRQLALLQQSEHLAKAFADLKQAQRRLEGLMAEAREAERAHRAARAAEEAALETEAEPAETAGPEPSAAREESAPIQAEAAPAPEAAPAETPAEKKPAKKPAKAKPAEPDAEPKAAEPLPQETAPAEAAEKPAKEAAPAEKKAAPEKPAEKKPAQNAAPAAKEAPAKGANKAGTDKAASAAAEAPKAPKAPPKAEAPAAEPKAEEPPKKKIIFKEPIRKLSLEELAAINRPRPKPSKEAREGKGNIQRTFINHDPRSRTGAGRTAAPGAARPGQTGAARPGRPGGLRAGTAAPMPASQPGKSFGNKKKTPEKTKSYEDKAAANKRSLIKKGLIQTAIFDEDRMGTRSKIRRKSKQQIAEERIRIEHAVVNSETIPIKVLSEKLGVTASEIIKRLFKDGVVKTTNESLDYETAAVLALDMGITLELKMDKTAEEMLNETHGAESEDEADLVSRPPVVTVMGHVDHGKTSLLDAIRKTNVAGGEAGGITQHIGAYTIKVNNNPITFIDTPGHEAFTAMRARGAMATDIAVLGVAADDGVMPQTVESISHAKAAGVPIIVAINKMDKPTADPDRIKQQLTEYEVLPEEWGGDTIMVPVSAATGEGLNNLLESILLLAEYRGLKANPDRKARGIIIEAKLDKGKGPMASVLVQNGTLRVGDHVISGTTSGRIRAMLDDKGRNVKEAGPSYAVSVLGLSEVPNAGDPIFAVEDDKLTKQVLEERVNKIREEMNQQSAKVSLDDVFSRIAEGEVKGLNLIVKADVQGSVEAVKQALLKLSNDEVKVHVIHGAVGAINETDVMLASTAQAIIIGFNVRPDAKAKAQAEHSGVDIRLYRIIYEAIDDISAALKGMLAPKFRETVMGEAEVRNVFKITGVGAVAGCYVTSGKILRNSKLRLLRDNVVIFEGEVASLKRFKDDVKEVAAGFECGISIANYNDLKEHDVIESFVMEEVKAD